MEGGAPQERESSALFGVRCAINPPGGVEAATTALLHTPPPEPAAAAAATGVVEAADAGPVWVQRCPATFQLAENPAGLWACRCCGRRYRPEAAALLGAAAAAVAGAAPAAAAERSIEPRGGAPGKGPARAPPACLLCGVALGPDAPALLLCPPLLWVARP